MDGKVLQLPVHDKAEREAREADEDAAHEERPAVHPEERHRAEVGQDELRLVGVRDAGGQEGAESEEERGGAPQGGARCADQGR